MKKFVVIVLALVCAVSFAQYPKSIKDDLGRMVVFRSSPKKVVSMFPSATETICALSACGRLVAVDDYSNFPESVKTLPKVGGLYNPNLEAIVAQKPDLVIVSTYGKLHEALETAGIQTFAVDTSSYEDIFKGISLLGRVLGLEGNARKLNSAIKTDVLKLELKAAASKTRPTVYFEIDPTPYSVGPNSFIGVLLTKSKARNIIPSELGDWPQVSPELVVSKNPSFIILSHPDLAGLKTRPGWNGITAVKSNKFCQISGNADDLISRPGPRIAQGLKILINCLHPELK